MSGYCPAGKCKCEHFECDNFDHTPGCNHNNQWHPLPSRGEVCPWPSRQVRVEPQGITVPAMSPTPKDIKDVIERIKQGQNGWIAGRLSGLREARDFVADDAWAITFQTMAQYRTALLAAIDAVEGE